MKLYEILEIIIRYEAAKYAKIWQRHTIPYNVILLDVVDIDIDMQNGSRTK